MLRTGMFLQNRYEIIEVIGSGGMSDVYKAKCHKLNRLVAIKVLKEEFSMDANFVSKFKMEAQAAAGLSHPNIVNIYDVVDEGTLHYIVMELIEGVTLKRYIVKKGHLEVKETIGISIQVAQGLAAAHEQKLVHRDIKPQNIIISKDGKVKVADFGIARAVSAQTQGAMAIGSVHYISPEQARGRLSDARSDLYSLGITMYEMVTGRVPFEGDNTVTVALAHLEEPITRPSIYNPDLPSSLENIILKCTEKRPERRYSSAAELIGDLRRALVNPDKDFVKQAAPTPSEIMGQTRQITSEEMEQIKEGSRKTVPYEPEPTVIPVQKQPEYPPSGKRKKKEEDDINPKLEKLLTLAGAAVAVIIVAVLVTVVMKLGGIVNLGSGKNPTADTQIGETAESTLSDTEVAMPDVKDLPMDLAEARLKESSLIMKVVGYEESDEIEKGHVISQENEVGSAVPKYSTVNVIVSNGSNKIDLSELNLTNLEEAAAKRLLETKKLPYTTVEENSETVEKGKIIRFDPQSVKEGETVTLYVSLGPVVAMKTVPNLVGQNEEIAIGLLVDAGLIPGQATTENSDTVPIGTVISQVETAGIQLPEGSGVSYVVSAGPAEDNKRYIASLSETYNLSNLIGPGSGSTSVTVMIRLKQIVDGEAVYKTLMQPQTLSGNVMLPVNLPVIEGAKGVTEGEVEIVEVSSDAVLKSYPVTFVVMD